MSTRKVNKICIKLTPKSSFLKCFLKKFEKASHYIKAGAVEGRFKWKLSVEVLCNKTWELREVSYNTTSFKQAHHRSLKANRSVAISKNINCIIFCDNFTWRLSMRISFKKRFSPPGPKKIYVNFRIDRYFYENKIYLHRNRCFQLLSSDQKLNQNTFQFYD